MVDEMRKNEILSIGIIRGISNPNGAQSMKFHGAGLWGLIVLT